MLQKATELTPKQLKAVEMLLSKGTVHAAAKAAGVHRGTMHRWMTEEVFVRRLHEAEQEAVAALGRSLVVLAEAATMALRDALDTNQPIQIRLRAAGLVIDRLLLLREATIFEERLTELERQVKEGQ